LAARLCAPNYSSSATNDQQICIPTNVRLIGIPEADANSTDPAIQEAVRFLRSLEREFQSELVANVFPVKSDWVIDARNRLSVQYNLLTPPKATIL